MQRLFDIKKTQLELVRDRGYEISPEEANIFNMTLEQFVLYLNDLTVTGKRSVRSSLSRTYEGKDNNGNIVKSMLVYYGGKTNPTQKQVSADIVRDFINLSQQYNITEAILIVDAPLSSTGNTALADLKSTKWQIFYDSELVYNPTTHIDTPYHELLSPEEAKLKLVELKVDISKLLILRADDAIVRYYGWSAGGIVRIHRDDQYISILAPKSINYRVIVG